jgi:hypothetical protein
MKKFPLALAAVALMGLATGAQAYDPKATIADLDARLAKIGAPRIEGTEDVAGKDVPAIYFGERKINNNYDVVDAVRKAHSATATVFVKDGDEFVRVSAPTCSRPKASAAWARNWRAMRPMRPCPRASSTAAPSTCWAPRSMLATTRSRTRAERSSV